MKFSCDNCQAQYMISDEKVGPAGVRVRCKKCSHVIFVKRLDKEPPAEDSTVVVSKEKMAQLSISSAVVEADPASAALPSNPPSPLAETKGPAGSQTPAAIEDEIGQALDSMFSDTKPATSVTTPAASGGSRPPVVLGSAPLSRGPASPFGALDASPSEMVNFDPPELTQIASPSSAASSPPAAKASEWFIAIQDEQVGPLKAEEIRARFEKGEVGSDTLVWATGLTDWRPLSNVEELAELIVPKKEIVRISRLPIPSEPVREPPKREPVAFRPSAASALASLASMAKEEMAATGRSFPAPPRVTEPSSATSADSVSAQLLAGLPSPPPSSTAIPVAPSPQNPESVPSASLADYRRSPLAQTKPRRKAGLRVLAIGAVVGVLLAGIGIATYTFVIKPQRDFEARVEREQREEAQRQKDEKARQDALAAVPPAAPAPPKAAPVPTPAVPVAVPPPPPAQPVARAAVPEPAPKQESARDKRGNKHGKGGREGGESPVAAATPQPATHPEKAAPAKGADDFLAAGDVDKEFAKEIEGSGDNGKASAKHGPYIPPAPGQADLPVALSQSDIVGAVTQRREAFAKCVQEQKRRDPSASGTVVMRWRIRPDGRSTDIAAKGEDYADSPLASCFKSQIGKLHFGAYRGSQMAPIEFPFSF